LEFRAILKAITPKRMEIDPYCQQQNCSPLNVLFIDVQISLILLGVSPLGGYNYITPRRAVFVSDSWAFLF